MNGILTNVGCVLLAAIAVVASRRFHSVKLGWGIVAAAGVSTWVGATRGATADEPIRAVQLAVSVWSFSAVLVGILPLILRRGHAAGALALILAVWLDHPAATALLWYVATANRGQSLILVGIVPPLICLLGSDASEPNPNAFAALVALTVTMAFAARPTLGNGQSLAAGPLIGLVVLQLRSAITVESLPDWTLGASVFPAATMLYLLGGGRGLKAETLDDVLTATKAVAAAFVATAMAAAVTVGEAATHWLFAAVSMLAAVAAIAAMRPRPAELGLPESLDFLAGQADGRPLRMALFSVLSLNVLTFVPLPNGLAAMTAARLSMDTTKTDPQPAFLLTCLAVCGSIALVPVISNVLMSVWLAERRGPAVRFRAMAWVIAVFALVGPLVGLRRLLGG